MSKAEFMRQLEQLLSDIPTNERAEALNYYEEYFIDAGVENEQRVLMELGSPWQVAQTIREGVQPAPSIPENYNTYNTYDTRENTYQGENTGYEQTKKRGLPTWAIVLIVIGGIFASPVVLGLAVSALGLIVCYFALIIGFGASAVALLVAGISVVIAGIFDCVIYPMPGIALAGAGLVIFALGMLFMMFVVWLCGVATPAIFRGIASLFKKKAN